MSPPGVTRVSSSRSPVMAPTSSVITPPMVELNEDQLVSATLTSVRLARRQHLVKCCLLVGVDAEVPVRLDPDPPPGVLAPVFAVRRFPRLRPLVPFVRFAPASVLKSASGSLAYASRSAVLHSAELAPERQAFASGTTWSMSISEESVNVFPV